MATDCSPFSAFVFTSEPLGRKHAVGVSKSSELSRVSAPTHHLPNRACPTVLPLRQANCFCNLAIRLSGFARSRRPVLRRSPPLRIQFSRFSTALLVATAIAGAPIAPVRDCRDETNAVCRRSCAHSGAAAHQRLSSAADRPALPQGASIWSRSAAATTAHTPWATFSAKTRHGALLGVLCRGNHHRLKMDAYVIQF